MKKIIIAILLVIAIPFYCNADKGLLVEFDELKTEIEILKERIKDLELSIPSPANIFINSDFLKVNQSGFPETWRTYGNGVTAEVVHPYTKAFIGPYTEKTITGTVNNPEHATENSPYWYGRYNCGPRISRQGWGDRPFKLLHLKISGNAIPYAGIIQHSNVLFIGNETGRYHIRCYVKVIKGKLGFSQDVNFSQVVVTKDECGRSPQGWYLVDHSFEAQRTSPKYIGFGKPRNDQDDLECYIALPYLYAENALWRN